MDNLVIAIDPGREKCGMAVVHREQGVLVRKVVSTELLTEEIGRYFTKYDGPLIVVGDRTGSLAVRNRLQQTLQGTKEVRIIAVDEHRSTEEARRLYWRENPPRGMKRLIPLGMQVPPCPVDDYVAVILAHRYFDQA